MSQRAHMRRYDRDTVLEGGGHKWVDIDVYDYESAGGGADPFRKAALHFLNTLEPADVYAVDTSPNTIVIFYRGPRL